MERSKGQWNAYVEAGTTREERGERLEEVPISIRDDVRRHVETVFAIKRYHSSIKENRR